MRSGPLFYECAASSEGAGKPLSQCNLARGVWTVHDAEDRELGAREGAESLRRHRMLRLSEEARRQGGLLTQEDLSELLFCDVRTIRRAVQYLRGKGIIYKPSPEWSFCSKSSSTALPLPWPWAFRLYW